MRNVQLALGFSFSLLDKAKDWENRYKEMELLIGPFREQLEAFDAERQALELQKEAAEGEMRELSLRYAEILGHQNHKQKIKHVIKLKDQIYELKKVGSYCIAITVSTVFSHSQYVAITCTRAD
jgi:hyaluronan-mediated motility receptor